MHWRESAIGESAIALPLEPPSNLLPHPIPLGCHKTTGFGFPLPYSELPLGMYFAYGVYILQCCSLGSSHLLPPLLCPGACSPCVHLHFCPVDGFISTTFLDGLTFSTWVPWQLHLLESRRGGGMGTVLIFKLMFFIFIGEKKKKYQDSKSISLLPTSLRSAAGKGAA